MSETIINGIIEESQEIAGQMRYAIGAKGDTGDSGVYIGTTPPTDPNIKVWIDTSEESGDVEMTSNKVTSISSESTDIQYPSAKAVNEAIQTVKTDKQDMKSYVNNNFSNALRGSASGEAVRLTDVSPIEHEIKIKLKSKNLFNAEAEPLYLIGAEKTLNGTALTFISNSVSARYAYKIPIKVGRQYTVSVKSLVSVPASGQSATGSEIFLSSTGHPDTLDYGSITSTSLTKTFTAKSDYLYIKQYVCYGTNQVGGKKTVDGLQVEEGASATSYAPYISDFSGVTLKRCGRNLVDISDGNSAASESTVDITESWPRGINIVGSAYLERSVNQPCRLRIGYVVDGKTNYLFGEMIYSSGIGTVKGTIPISATQVNLTFQELINSEGDIYWKNVQLEIGDSATDYRAFQQQNYIANADGTVPGVTSISDDTTLMTDAERVIIEAEYNRDINKAFAALEAAIVTNNS